MRRVATICITIVCAISIANAQALTSKEKIDSWNDSSRQAYGFGKFEAASLFADSAMYYATLQGYQYGIAHASQNLCYTYHNGLKANTDSALFYAKKCYDIALKNGYERLVYISLSNLSMFYDTKGEYTKSLDLAFKLLGEVDSSEIDSVKKEFSFIAYSRITNVYLGLEDYAKALQYLEESKKYSTDKTLGGILANVAYVHAELGNYEDSYKQALTALDLLLEYSTNPYDTIGGLYIAGRAAYHLELTDDSRDLLERSLAGSHELNDTYYIVFTLNILAEIAFSKKNYDLASSYYEEAVMKSKISNMRIERVKSFAGLYKTFLTMGHLDKSLDYHVKYSDLNDSLFNEERSYQLTEIETKFETEKKEAENELLKKDADLNLAQIAKQKQLILLVLIAVGLLLAFAYFIYSSLRRQKKLTKQVSAQKNELEKQSRELQALDKFKSRFFANVSHDLRTPLTLIKGRINQLQEDDSSFLSRKAEQILEKLQHDTAQLNSFSDEIRQLIALDEGKLTLQYSEIKPYGFFNTIFTMFSSYADMRQVAFDFSSDVDPNAIIHLDVNNLQKVMYNLISNAFKFTPADGTIAISLHQRQEGIVVQIKDTGIGISEDKQKHVFERYYQADNEYAIKEGLGIGLSLAKEIIELHQGTISVDSDEGEGAAFNIYLPFNIHQILSEGADMSYEFLLEKKNNLQEEEINTGLEKAPILQFDDVSEFTNTILVVDDHAEIRKYISELLTKDYKVIQAINGKHALHVLKKYKVDVVVTDLMMPWMDGYDFIEAIKNDLALCDIPVMVVSARVSDLDKSKVLQQGVNNFMSKPFDPLEFQQRINNLIDQNNDKKSVFSVNNDDDMNKMKSSALEKLNNYILNNLDKHKITSDELADELLTSKRNLYRLIRELTGKTPLEYHKSIRFQYVFEKLKGRQFSSLEESASQVGIKNTTDFKKQFIDRFGKDPSTMLNI